MKKIILTGFFPFGGYNYNPTEEIIKYFNSSIELPQIEIIGVVLSSTYSAFTELSILIDKEKPDAIISIGLSSGVKGVRIETIFRNLMEGKYPDNNGYAPSGIKINNYFGAREFLAPNANCLFLLNVLHSEKIPVEISSDANTFICNCLGYQITQKILDNNLNIRNMFIHIPWTDNYKDKIEITDDKIFLERKKLIKAIKILIKNILK